MKQLIMNGQFSGSDGRSREMYRYLRERKDSLNYVVVCTGNEKVKREISGDLVQFFKQEGNKTPVFECSYDGVRRVDSRNLSVRRWQIYTPDVLCTQEMDRKAVMLNLRWCAFHYVMGYEPMLEDVLEARCEQYLTETESNGCSSLRITEDPARRQHACLIGWDELDALSERLNQVTGGSKNVLHKLTQLRKFL